MRKFKVRECKFCKENIDIDYKDVQLLKSYTTEKGKIFPRRISGCCSKHQRELSRAIKRSRHAALIPFQAEL